MKYSDYQLLLNDKVMKERSRLLILSCLMAAENGSAVFMNIQKALDLSRGNLSVQIQILKDAGYVDVNKAFVDNKPQTTVSITMEGIVSLRNYLADMEKIIKLVERDKG